MKTSYFKMILIVAGFVAIVGVACLSSGNADPTATLAPPILQPEPTTEEVIIPQPTTPPSNFGQSQPTQEVLDEPDPDYDNDAQAYYTEEFDGDLDSYTYFLMNGEEDKMDLYTDNGRLVFDLQGTYQYVYVLYDEYTYPEAVISLVAENRGKNTNNVSLVCNYSERDGWYEFNISNGGLYDILVYSEMDGGYFTLQSGGSKNVRTGRSVNEYTAVCQGNKLALYINGYLEKEFTDNRYKLREGQVGFGVSSFDVIPILVEVDSFSIDLP